MEVYDYTSSMNYIYPEHPVVALRPDEDTIATALIRESIEYTKRIGKTRLETFFDGITEETMPTIDLFRGWYETSDDFKS